MDGVWTLAVTLPPDIDAQAFVAATVAENVPWLIDGVASCELRVASTGDGVAGGRNVRVPFGLSYSEEEREQLPLVAAKVVYFLRGGDQAAAQEAGTAGEPSAVADGSA